MVISTNPPVNAPVYGLLSERAAKRSLQGRVLSQMIRNMQLSGRRPLTVLCLPGSEGFDLGYLSKFDCVQRIVALERDPAAFANLRVVAKGFPKVELVEGDLGPYLASTTTRFDLLYLDYCSNFNLLVEDHVRTVVDRQILAERGCVVLNVLGARETRPVQARNQALFEAFDAKCPSGETWRGLGAERQRLVAINALFAEFRSKPSPAGHFAAFGSPRWHKYRTRSAFMYTGVFRFREWSTVALPVTPRHRRDVWFARGRFGVKEQRAVSMQALAKVESPAAVREVWRRRILAFYAENGFAPTASAFDRTGLAGWMDLVRSAGLCPRHGPSRGDVLLGLRRLVADVAPRSVRETDLRRAKLAGLPFFRTPNGAFSSDLARALCAEAGGLFLQVSPPNANSL